MIVVVVAICAVALGLVAGILLALHSEANRVTKYLHELEGHALGVKQAIEKGNLQWQMPYVEGVQAAWKIGMQRLLGVRKKL